jgi:hypothetical protein
VQSIRRNLLRHQRRGQLQKVQQPAIQARLNYFLGADESGGLFVGFEILHIENEVRTSSVRPTCTGEV